MRRAQDEWNAFEDRYAAGQKPAAPRPTNKLPAPAPAPAALPVNPFAPPMDTRDPGVSAYDENYGPENPAWYSGPNAGQYSGSRMEAGTDLGFGTPGPEDPSWYAEQGKKAPRPDRGFLQSLSDGIGDAVTNVGQYVQDTPNLLQLGINMMAAANAPSKAEQWQQFAGSFDQFGRANKADEDRKLTMEDRQREIERQKKADARAEVVAGQQDTQFGWTKDEREYATKNRERLAALQKTMIDNATDPMFRDTIAAQSPEMFGEFLGNRLLRADDAKAQADRDADQRAFTAGQNSLDRALQRELTDIRKSDPMQTVEGRASLQVIEPYLQAAGAAGPAKVRVQQMKEIIQKLHAMGGANQPIDADTRIYVSRLLGQNPNAQQLLEEYNRLALTFTLDEVQKLKPASNLDFENIQKNLPNANNNPLAALNMLNQMEKDLNGATRGAIDRIKWVKQGYSMYGTNTEGKTYFEVHPYDQGTEGAPAPSAPASGAPAPPKPATIAPPSASSSAGVMSKLPDPAGYALGTPSENETTGEKYVVNMVQGKKTWVRISPGNTVAPRAAPTQGYNGFASPLSASTPYSFGGS
jgi:hypothetical protein